MLFSSIMPLYSIINITMLKKDFAPGSSLMFMTVFSIMLPIFLKVDEFSILDLIHNNEIKFNFKYSDNYAGIKSMNSYLNSSFMYSISWIVYGILLARTIVTSSIPTTLNTDWIYYIYYIYGVSAFAYLALGLINFLLSAFSYYRFQKNFKKAKKDYLRELEKNNTFESLYLYYKVSQKNLSSLFDRILEPIKILIAPTIIAFARAKIFTVEDLNRIYNLIFH